MSQSQCCWSSSQTSYPSNALVGHYPANKLIGHEPILRRRTLGSAFQQPLMRPVGIVGISIPFGKLFPT